jgi:two-component system chemotaxis response regulator CheB
MSITPPPTSKVSTAHISPVRVIVVDDSAIIRGFISRAIDGDAAISVVGSAGNGEIAIDLLKRVPADVIILDIEMPVMDGLTAIPKLKEIDPAVQIIMASTLTQKNAEVSLKAMSLGATDYIPKPSARDMSVAGDFQRELVDKVKALGAVALRKNVRQSTTGALSPRKIVATDKKPLTLRPLPIMKPDIIAIGSSTGGPQALFEVIRSLGAALTQPVVITQHMPPSFTTILADHISRQCGVSCSEAKNDEVLQGGRYYVAPGDFHMLIHKKAQIPTVQLVKDPPENFCRPAVDPMLRSLVEAYGNRILTIILTGMGQDGLKGGECVVKAGGVVMAQDEATSVVWGMPGAVATAGLCSAILPLSEIGQAAKKIATKGSS